MTNATTCTPFSFLKDVATDWATCPQELDVIQQMSEVSVFILPDQHKTLLKIIGMRRAQMDTSENLHNPPLLNGERL